MGMGRGVLDGFSPFGTGSGNLPQLYDQVVLNLSSVVLFGALVAFRRLDEVGGDGTGRGPAVWSPARSGERGAPVRPASCSAPSRSSRPC